MELKLLTCLCAVFVIIDVNGERCHHHLRQITSTQTTSAIGQAITFSLQQPAMIERININVCDQDRALADGTFNVTFVDASDFTNQERIYSENQNGKWSLAATKNVYAWITFNPVLYTRKLTIKHWYAVQCSTLHVLGCSPNEMFNQTFCKNGGTVIEKDQCACPTGYIGSSCDIPVRDMTVDDFDFVANISNIVYTKDAAFNISGEVSFTFDDQSTDTKSRRHLHHSLGHLLHGLAHFTGHGGSLHYSANNLAGFLHSNHHTYGHHPSHSIYSGLNNLLTGFSHSVQVKFGHNHHHSNYHYFYTTHGTNHLSHGASLHFHNHFLHMNVHYANSNGHHHHFHLNFKWNPLPHIKYNIVSSFHPHLGASLFINGHNVASLNRPAVTAPHNNFPGIPQPLCFGLCGAKPGSGPSNLTVGNIAVAGANVATMAKNFLLGLLGLPMLNLLTPQATTSTPLKTTVATKVSSTTSHHGGFTLAPTSTPPATATAANTFTATTPPNIGPSCYSCTNTKLNGACFTTSQCYPGEVCAVFDTNNGFIHRCMGKQLCDSNMKSSNGCWNCCTGNLCNKQCTSVATCTDTPQCARLLLIGYSVCNDPVVSVLSCSKTCNKCSSSG